MREERERIFNFLRSRTAIPVKCVGEILSFWIYFFSALFSHSLCTCIERQSAISVFLQKYSLSQLCVLCVFSWALNRLLFFACFSYLVDVTTTCWKSVLFFVWFLRIFEILFIYFTVFKFPINKWRAWQTDFESSSTAHWRRVRRKF